MALKAVNTNPESLSRGQKAAMTRKRNQIAQMVANIVTEKPRGKSDGAGLEKET